jgi:hypothetical protein
MDPTLGALLTVAGLAPVVSIIVEALVRAAGPTFPTDRVGPIVAIVIGVVTAVLASYSLDLLTKASVATAVLTGILAGGTAMGIHDVVTGAAAATNVGRGVSPR